MLAAGLLVSMSAVTLDITVPLLNCFFSPFPTAVSRLNCFSHALERVSAPSVLASDPACFFFPKSLGKKILHTLPRIIFSHPNLACSLTPAVIRSPGFPGGSEVKVSASNAGDPGSIPGSGRSPGEGSGNPLQYSCLENPMDGEAWWATVDGVTKSRTRLGDFTFTYQFT